MTHAQMKFYWPAILYGVLASIMAVFSFSTAATAQNSKARNNFEIFNDQLPTGAQLNNENEIIRKGGYLKNSTHYLYVNPSTSPAEITGLSIPIRENPGPGEYRYITFAWIKWGGDQIGLKLGAQSTSPAGRKYNYTYVAGKGDTALKGLKIADKAPGNWIVVTRDLWKDFGNFTLTGVSFICPERRDAGFDAIILGKTPDTFEHAPGVLPTEVAAPIDIDEDGNIILSETIIEDESAAQPQKVEIDWAAQIKAGGFMMYPLYLLALVAIIIALQRSLTSRESRLAPLKLRQAVRDNLSNDNLQGALKACDKYPSTLAESLRFILQHRKSGREVVSQTAGDIAARDIRTHLSRIYPLSVIASLAPLLGLLGTIVGMIEAFGLVALYGDEGGAAILSDSISKALITTAAGLIIAVPAIAVYFIIKNRIMRLSAQIEVGIENVINDLYLTKESEEQTTNTKDNQHASAN